MGELIIKVMEDKEIDLVKFQESDAYKLALNTVTTQFLYEERVKMRRIL